MLLLGLTGGIACGKSTVARLLAARGAVLIDSDALVHELYADRAFALGVAQLFDEPILRDDGSVDRVALGKIVFNDAEKLRALESLVHPAVAALRAEKLRAAEALAPPAIVLEAVKLLEAGHAQICDAAWCVLCDETVQLRRLMKNRGLSESEARVRLAHQPSLESRRALANGKPFVVIENNGTLPELEERVESAWQKFLKSHEY
jgi:dephospho-CoA kinase